MVESVATCLASYKTVWLQNLLSDLFDIQLDVTCIFYENQSYMDLSKNPVFHDNSKHIDIKFHYITDMVQRGAVKLQYMETEE